MNSIRFNTFRLQTIECRSGLGGSNDINVCRCTRLFLTGMGIAFNITALTVTLVFSDTKPQGLAHTNRKQK